MFKFRCDFYNFFTESEDFFSIQIDNTDFVTQKDLFLEAMSRAYEVLMAYFGANVSFSYNITVDSDT